MKETKIISLVLVVLCFSLLFLYDISLPDGYLNDNKNNLEKTLDEIRAEFSYSPAFPRANQNILFYNLSTGEPDYFIWNFGDGVICLDKNPIHNYKVPSIYYVTLRVSKGNRINSINKKVIVASAIKDNYPALKADFVYEPNRPEVGTPVRFYDTSLGDPVKRTWQFGYYNISLLPYVIRTFYKEGRYAVTLTVRNLNKTDKITKYIEVVPKSSDSIIAKSCNYEDVRDAIKSANPGDVIIVPDGTAVWSKALIIDKGIILKAGTKGGVTIISGSAAGTNGDDPNNYIIAYCPTSVSVNQTFRLSGFNFDGGNNRFIFYAYNPYLTPIMRFRLDNNKFKNSRGFVISFSGEIYGVIDNNTIYGGNSFITRDFSLNETTWSNLTFDYGTEKNRYYEDNIVYIGEYGAWNEGGLGGRYCARFNTIIHLGSVLCMPFDMHGNMGTGGNHSTMGVEIYGNVINANSKSFRLFDHRGGKALVYNNTITNAGGDSYYGGTIREEYNDNLNPPASNPAGQPQHVSDSYYWNNVVNGITRYPTITQTLNYEGDKGIVPRWDIHCWKQVASFDGTSGIGSGPVSQRPLSCTAEGVAWWATDEKKLYRWKYGRWELYYTPYTYPHPLRTILGD